MATENTHIDPDTGEPVQTPGGGGPSDVETPVDVPQPDDGGGLVDPGTQAPEDETITQPDVELPDVTGGPDDVQAPEPGQIEDPVMPTGNTGVTGQAPQADVAPADGLLATTREVQDDELVSHQLNKLLDENGQFIQAAKRTGLAQSNARGGLGGSVGIGAAVNAAIRAGLPIATADAQAYRDAAAQNQNALNQFSLATMQRMTQLELGNLDASTRVQMQSMANANQLAVAHMNNATQRSIANLDAKTKLQMTELEGQIRGRLADMQFRQNMVLNDQLHGQQLENIALQGEYGLANTEAQAAANLEANYMSMVTGIYDSYNQQIANVNGIEMDDAARTRAYAAINQGTQGMFDLVNSLFQDRPPIIFSGNGG
jgi:hypothetical protein